VRGPRYCVGELPLYLFQSLLRLGLPCIWGPGCFVGSVKLPVCNVNGGAFHRDTPSFASPPASRYE
jgi:hypothetical protein